MDFRGACRLSDSSNNECVSTGVCERGGLVGPMALRIRPMHYLLQLYWLYGRYGPEYGRVYGTSAHCLLLITDGL